MEIKKVLGFVLAVIVCAAVICGVVLYNQTVSSDILPEKTVDDTVAILAESGIIVNKNILPDDNTSGNIYIMSSGDYAKTVSSLLGESEVRNVFLTPGGKLVTLDDGSLYEYSEHFSFYYSKYGKKNTLPSANDIGFNHYQNGDTNIEKIKNAVLIFLESGNGTFEQRGQITVSTEVDRICEVGEKYYVVCSRNIDGIPIKDNYVVCVYENGEVTEASGTWCFLTGGESHRVELCDSVNLMFAFKKNFRVSPENPVTVENIEVCYALSYYGDGEDVCFIPSYKITCDNGKVYYFNALNGNSIDVE